MKDYEKELQKHEQIKESNSAAENVIKFYSMNKSFCDKAYNYYKEYKNFKNLFLDSQNISVQSFIKNLGANPILIVTSNPIEEAILLHSLFDYTKKRLKCFFIEDYVYGIAKIKKYTIVHIHTKSTGEESARVAINAATKIFSPIYVFLLGICYGFDHESHVLGTVVISNKVLGLHVDFRDYSYEFIEEFNKQPDLRLIDKLENRLNYFQPENKLLNDSVNMTAKTGIIISINSLVSNKKFKNSLFNAYKIKPRPLGGEMEVKGLFKTDWFENQGQKKWLVIKSICDWGESKNLPNLKKEEKEKIKDSLQALAMSYTWTIFEMIIENELI